MNVSLTRELERFVQAKVDSGLYTSASEVIRESLRLLHEHEYVKGTGVSHLNADIDIGLQQLEAGKVIDGNDSYRYFKSKIHEQQK